MLNINRNGCQPLRYKKAECRSCVEACPVEGCLTFADGTLSVNRAECTGCGVCTTVCLTGALMIDGLDDVELLARIKDALEKKDLFIGCHLGPAPVDPGLSDAVPLDSSLVQIPCLAILKESHLVALALSGVGRIDLDLRRCGRCALGGAGAVVRKTVRYAENLLARTTGAHESINVVERMEALPGVSKSAFGIFRKNKSARKITRGPEFSRRELFTFLKSRTAALAEASADEGVSEDASGSVEVPQKRQILLDALRGAGVAASGALKEGEFPVRGIGIDQSCVMCTRCDAFCPTGALKRTDSASEASIEFRATLCMGCLQCKEFCPAGALFYEEEVGLESLRDDTVRVVMKKETVNCPKCSKPFIPQSEKDGCPGCGKKKRLDDSILSIIFSDTGREKRTEKEAV